MFLVFLDYHLRYIYAEIEYIWGKRQNKKRRVIRKRLKKAGQNAEVMPRPVRRSVNGGLVHVCFSVTPGMAVSMREN